MDYIIRNTTPTFTLTIVDDIPEGGVPSVTITQGSNTLTPEVEFDRDNKTVSFSLSSEESGMFEAGTDLFIQQTMSFPSGYTESFPIHVVSVEEMLYQGESPLPEPASMVVVRKTKDTTVNPNVVYYDILYSEVNVTGMDSPLDMGLLENVNGEYIPSQDLAPIEGTVYYTESLFPVEPVGNENPSELGWLVIENRIVDLGDISDTDQNDSLYQPVVPIGNENPSELGWLVIDENDLYVLTTDTTVNPNTFYYTTLEDILPDNVEALYMGFDKEDFYAKNGITSVDGMDFSSLTGLDNEWTVDSDATGGIVPKDTVDQTGTKNDWNNQ